MTEITEQIAVKVRDVVDAGLVRGQGSPEPGNMCVEAAVCYALDLPHGDDPQCVSRALRRLKIRLNDALWSSTSVRAKGLRRLALAQLGSRDVLNDAEFARRVVDITIRRVVPCALRRAAQANPAHTQALEKAAKQCEIEGNEEACLAARAAAYAAAATAAATAASAAASAAAYAAADAATAAYAASAAASAAAYAAADVLLAQFAEWVVEILIEMKAPGCQWLYLVPKS